MSIEFLLFVEQPDDFDRLHRRLDLDEGIPAVGLALTTAAEVQGRRDAMVEDRLGFCPTFHIGLLVDKERPHLAQCASFIELLGPELSSLSGGLALTREMDRLLAKISADRAIVLDLDQYPEALGRVLSQFVPKVTFEHLEWD